MKKYFTKAELRALGLYNSYGIAEKAGSRVYVRRRPVSSDSFISLSAWQVVGVGFNTNPTAGFSENGCKTFYFLNDADPLEEAKKWALQHFGITAWERDVYQAWHPASTIAAAVNKAKREEP